MHNQNEQWFTSNDFSGGSCINEEDGYLLPTLSSQDFAISSEYSSCHQGDVHMNRHCSFLPASSSRWASNQGLPVLHFGWSAPQRVKSRCAGPPSPTAPIPCHGPALSSLPSGSADGFPMHAPLHLSSPSFPSHRHLGVPLVSLQMTPLEDRALQPG